MHHEADGHQVGAVVIQKRAAAGLVVERPAQSVLNQARPVLVRLHLPQLFQAEPVLLRLTVFGEPEFGGERLYQGAACAFRNHGVLGAQFDAALEVVGGLAVLADALEPVATPMTAPLSSYSASDTANSG